MKNFAIYNLIKITFVFIGLLIIFTLTRKEKDYKYFLNEVVKFVAKAIKLQSLPRRIVIVNDVNFAEKNLSFGVYSVETDEIHVYGGTRQIGRAHV